MTTWSEFETQAPTLAATIRGRFEAHLHHIVATLRRDGSPRVSGTEARFHDGQLWLGMMPGSLKRADLVRDPRLALHAAPLDTELKVGDAKVDGVAVPVDDLAAVQGFLTAIGNEMPPEDGAMFVVDLRSAVLTHVEGDRMVVESWTPGSGVRVDERE